MKFSFPQSQKNVGHTETLFLQHHKGKNLILWKYVIHTELENKEINNAKKRKENISFFQELTDENRTLNRVVKRQSLALNRLAGTEGELPILLRAHNEETRVLRQKMKQVEKSFWKFETSNGFLIDGLGREWEREEVRERKKKEAKLI